ncbi:MAG: Ig-like domain-containing protein [Gemmatimonadaceae bacterium]
MHKFRLLGATLLVVACSGDKPIGPLVVNSVVVTSAPTQISVNATAQATAIVRDQNGNPLAGKTIDWTSLNPNIATVTTAGLIRGVAAGTATIQGKVDGIVGTAQVIVIGLAQSCAGGPTVVDLAAGSVRVLSSSATNGCIRISSTAAASDYVVIAANLNAIPDILAEYFIKSDEGDVVPSNNLLASPATVRASVTTVAPAPGSDLQSVFERKLRLLERRVLDMAGGQRAFRERQATSDVRRSQSVAIPVVGEKTPFKVPSSCTNAKPITATVRYISTRAIIYTDDASPAGGFTTNDFQQIGDEFDNLIYPTDVAYFGTPLDLDMNARVIILYTPEVNRLTPSGNPGGFVGGFFFAGDLFPATGQNSCTQSNVGELFYLLAPDPDGTINGNVRRTDQVRQGTRGTIAHEFQHMINASERIRTPILVDDFESIWLDEAMGHLAEEATGRALKQIGEAENADFARLSGNTDDYNAYFFQNFARFQRYLQDPGPNSPTSAFGDSSLADRGAAWAFLRYVADNYAPGGDVKAFTKALAVAPDTGVANLLKRVGGGILFDTLASGWLVANYADDFGIPNLPVKYTYRSFNMRSNVAAITPSRTYPLVVTQIAGISFVSPTLKARSASGNYFRFTRAATAPARSFRFLNIDARTAASFTGAAFVILRAQ